VLQNSNCLPLFRYFLCDCLNFVNVIGQMYFVDKFLGGVFMTYGTDVLSFANTDDDQRTDPMMTVRNIYIAI